MRSSSISSSRVNLLFFLAIVLGCTASDRIAPKSGAPVTAKDLIAHYKANEVSADSSYKNRSLVVTGLVDTIGKDLLDTPYVTLNSGETISFPSVQCMGSRNSNEFAALRKGQQVKVVGVCTGKFGNILLSPCSIASNEITSDYPPSKVTSSPNPTSHDHLVWAKNAIATKDYLEAEKQLNLIPSDAPEYKEVQTLRATTKRGLESQKREMAPKIREELAQDYRQLVTDANPHLNFVDSKITKTKGGFALWATHDFFSQYSLSSGDDSAVIQEWISRNRRRLGDAGIVRVGLMGKGPYSSWVYFDVK
jgi:hypothetical protein